LVIGGDQAEILFEAEHGEGPSQHAEARGEVTMLQAGERVAGDADALGQLRQRHPASAASEAHALAEIVSGTLGLWKEKAFRPRHAS
jgi:hypothetical protein